MNTVDFSNYKFHPSGLKMLMTQPRSKSDRENGVLSETTKSYLQELWIKEVFGREKVVSTPAMKKGTSVETDSLELLKEVSGEAYFKNQRTIENDYLVGTPDVIDKSGNLVIDIKSSWDIWTFTKVEQSQALKDYDWQLTGYGWLTGMKNLSLVYALVNTPEFIIKDQLYKMSFSCPPETDMEQFRVNFIFDDIPAKMKIKRFNSPMVDEKIEMIKSQVERSRGYMKGLSL